MITTRLSLIRRLYDSEDREAWLLFVEIYFPAIYRSLRAKGLQHADAEDAAQQVLWSVSRSLATRPYDPNRAKFRTWLETVIRNAAINAMSRVPKDRGFGGGDSMDELPASTGNDERLLLHEYRKQLFQLAAEQVRDDFAESTWQAFWRTAVLGQDIELVADELGLQTGSVYAARSRVIKRFRNEIDAMLDSEGMNAPRDRGS